jgi:hypothetical protein
MKLNKWILLPVCSLFLLSITGCIAVPEGDGHEHAHYEHHDAVIVGPPVVVVRAPVVVVSPPVVVVRP